jgi:aryl-alcohol dehydrogenase-like predicted oxidoreductase
VLTGKYREGEEFAKGTRGGDTEEPITFTYRLHERAWSIVEAVRKVAEEAGKTPSQVALNWVLHRPGVTAPIIGARNMAQLADNLGAAGWQLEEEHWRALSWASAFPRGYPYDFIDYADAEH